MDSRRQMCLRIESGELSLSAACRLYGVTRRTGRKWLVRAREVGIECLAERSRKPLTSPMKTPTDKESALLGLKEKYPEWGAKKLVEILRRDHEVHLKVRTGDRILKRNGLVRARAEVPEPKPFERPEPNLLMQMDFKGSPRSMLYALLSVLDDHSRLSPHFGPIPDKTGDSVFPALWEMFSETGLPTQMLMDNGDCWGARCRRCPTAFESKLWRLGIMTIHGRPRHPQTQGKVERFHKTALIELGDAMFNRDVARVREACEWFRHRYNWIRPHEALNGRVPGSVYAPSTRKRPDKLPEAHIPEGAVSRKVQNGGFVTYKGVDYRLGQGLIGQHVEMRDDELGIRIYYASFPVAYLHEL